MPCSREGHCTQVVGHPARVVHCCSPLLHWPACPQAILDAYLCLVHLTLGVVVDSLLHSFGTIALMQFGELLYCGWEASCLCGNALLLVCVASMLLPTPTCAVPTWHPPSHMAPATPPPAVIFSVFEMRLLLTVSRARRGSSDSWTAQRDASLLYARFYAGLLGGILLTYQLQR